MSAAKPVVAITFESGRPPYQPRHTIGRCETCRAAWAWPTAAGKLADAYCPACAGPLAQTTRVLRRPFRIVNTATWRGAQAALRRHRAELVDSAAADAVTFGREGLTANSARSNVRQVTASETQPLLGESMKASPADAPQGFCRPLPYHLATSPQTSEAGEAHASTALEPAFPATCNADARRAESVPESSERASIPSGSDEKG